ncbi:MAG: nicotinate-nucleotide--dimethylbenzimidazole phosphoribosyltransferase [Actinomycetota bacterium]
MRSAVSGRNTTAEEQARIRWDALAKPPGALGRLEEIGVWLSGVHGACPPRPLHDVRVVVFAGDHGIARADVSAYPPSVTSAMLRLFLAGEAAVNALARVHDASVRVVDVAVDDDPTDLPSAVTAHKVRRASERIDHNDALTSTEVHQAFAAGIAIADEEINDGADLLIAGDMGIGNTTVAAALIGAELDLSPLDVVGTGTGIDNNAWARKVGALRDAMYRGGKTHDPLALLRTIGSADAAATTGFLIQAAVRGVPVLLDGVTSCACALVAKKIAPLSVQWWLAGHRSTEPAQHRALVALRLVPLLDLEMRLGEGTGALTAVPLLRSAQATLAEMALLTDVAAPPDPTN